MTRYLRGFDSLIAYQMRKLSIFDDNERIATITQIDSSIFLFARSSREWSMVKRLMRSYDQKEEYFLESVATLANGYNFSTELIDE